MTGRLLLADMRHHLETALAVAAVVAVGAGIAAFAWAFGQGAASAISLGAERLGADIVVVARGEGAGLVESLVRGDAPDGYLADPTAEIRETTGVTAATPQLFLQSAEADCCDEGDVLIVGIEPATDFVVSPWVAKGAIGPAEDIVAGAAIRRPIGLPLTFLGQRRIVVANLARTGWGYFDRGAFIGIEAARSTAAESVRRDDVVDVAVPAGSVSAVFVRSEQPEVSARALRTSLPTADVVVLASVGRTIRDSAAAAATTAWLVAVLAGLVAVGAIATLVWSATRRRRTDIALLRALGASKVAVVRVVVMQAAMLGLMGGLVGSATGLGLATLFANWFTYQASIPFVAPGPAAWLWGGVGGAVVCAVVSAIAAIPPALAAAAADPYQGLSA